MKNRVVRAAGAIFSSLVVASMASAADSQGASGERSQLGGLEEIVVTAQKRTEKLMDVPSAITAVGGDRLEALQVHSLGDLADYVPGMIFASGGGPGLGAPILRGISLGGNAPSVGTYIDDLPVGASASAVRGSIDLNPFDIDRIEVLKGPQGTLYGSNTIGGLIKYALRQPDLTRFGARVGTDVGHTNGAGESNWGVRASVNIPIVTDTLALLVSGFKNHNAGYLNNIGIGAKDVNELTHQGARGTLLWRPSDNLSLRATVLADDIQADSKAGVTMDGETRTPLYGSQTLNTHFAIPFFDKTRHYSLAVDWDLGFASLSSVTGWSSIKVRDTFDLSNYAGSCQPFPGHTGCPDYPHADALGLYKPGSENRKFVEEVRLTSRQDQRIQWMLGGFFTREITSNTNDFPAFTPSLVALPERNNLLHDKKNDTFKEKAVFANATYKINDRFDVSGGIRRSIYSEEVLPYVTSGVLDNGSFPLLGSTLPNVGVTTWMVNSSFHPIPEDMLYARVATAYRPGGGCKFHSDGTSCDNPAFHTPGSFGPDRTTNYELGFKADLLDRRLQADVAIFYIDWTDIQMTLLKKMTSPDGQEQSFQYVGNAGKASSQGVEVDLGYQATRDLRINANAGYTNAHLTKDDPGIGGVSGDALPAVPIWTGSLTLDYTRSLTDTLALSLGGGYRYRDNFRLLLPHNKPNFPLGPQDLVDLYAGLAFEKLTMRLTGSNIFNNYSYEGAHFINNATRPIFVPVQPRTIGLSMEYKF